MSSGDLNRAPSRYFAQARTIVKFSKMTDVRALRSTLSNTDASAPSIQSSASSMMRMYDKSPSLAVAEWRNVLQTCNDSQMLPLLYVANEVLQISKRNRGNKYLESFSPVLGSSLKVICERDPGVTEKVRRTAKIWGDRRIFSTRFVGELLAGLEEFRGGKKPAPSPAKQAVNFSPLYESKDEKETNQKDTISDHKQDELINDDPFEFDAAMNQNDDDDPFANAGPSQLNVSINVNKQALEKQASKKFSNKRSRTSPESSKEATNKKYGKIASSTRRRRSVLTTSSLVEAVDQLSNLDSESKSISRILSSIKSSDLFSAQDDVNEVGDELLELHTKVNTMIESTKRQRINLWRVAEGKRQTEQDLKRYLVWMKAGLDTDKDEIRFCEDLEQKLLLLQLVHCKCIYIHTFPLYFFFFVSYILSSLYDIAADAKKARDAERRRLAVERKTAEAAALAAAQKEEVKRSLEQIQKQSSMNDARPGMVWNKQTREYQYIDTEESWRD